MKIDCGIIGLPNVGKSTLFSILTNISVKIANFPFCTTDPNIAVVHIPESRIYQLANIAQSSQVMHASVEFVDTAGVIKGAASGIGLGDQVFSNIRSVKVLCHMVRCFNSTNVQHIINNNVVDPIRDIRIVNTELILSDMLWCEKNISFLNKKNKVVSTGEYQDLFILRRCLRYLNDGILLRDVLFSEIDKFNVKKFNFLTLKPVIYVANVSIEHSDTVGLDELYEYVHQKDIPVIPCCCVSLLSKDIVKSNFENMSNNIKLDMIIQLQKKFLYTITSNILSVLHLNTFFTVNSKMARAWVNPIGTTALMASNKVHSDFKIGFIRVRVIKFNDFIFYKGELGAKKFGKIRFEGKNYLIEDGDILKFMHAHQKN